MANDVNKAPKTKKPAKPVDTRIKGYLIFRGEVNPDDVHICRTAEEAMGYTERGYKAKKFIMERKRRGEGVPAAA